MNIIHYISKNSKYDIKNKWHLILLFQKGIFENQDKNLVSNLVSVYKIALIPLFLKIRVEFPSLTVNTPGVYSSSISVVCFMAMLSEASSVVISATSRAKRLLANAVAMWSREKSTCAELDVYFIDGKTLALSDVPWIEN